MMRIFSIILMVTLFLVSCESPMEPTTTAESSLYKGQVVEAVKAPFLLETTSLAKQTIGYVVIDHGVNAGTVYGSQNNLSVYAAVGGEVLPEGTWVANLNSAPVQVELSAKLTITFTEASTVTVMGAKNLKYVNADGVELMFTGDGVITALSISTLGNASKTLGKSSGLDGVSTTLISTAEFGIGGTGGEGG